MSNTITLIVKDEESNDQNQPNDSTNTNSDEGTNTGATTSEEFDGQDHTHTSTLVPNTGSNTPEGGLFAGSSLSRSAGTILIIVASVAILSMLLSNLRKRKNSFKGLSCHDNDFNLNHTPKVRTLFALSYIALFAIGGYMLSLPSDPDMVFADATTLSIAPTDTTVTITRKKDQVATFAIASTTIKLNSATNNGYKLFISAIENSNLKRKEDTTSENNVISTIALSDNQTTSALSLNSFAITTTNGSTATSSNWLPFPTKNNKLLFHEVNSATTENSTVIVYYGFYIGSDLPAGTYTGKVEYEAEARVVNYTCTKQYRLQNADGTYPSSYTADGTQSIASGGTCSYSKSITDYQTKSTSATMNESKTLSLDLPRNTYALTVNRNATYISNISGAGTYRWGQSVSVSATLASNSLFNGWSQTAGMTGSFGDTSSASTTFTMPKSDVTIYADGKKSNLTFDQAFAAAGKTKLNGYYKMQDASATICAAVNQGETGTLIDTRDNQTYSVAKLKDDKCWMTENLNLAGGAALSADNTDVTSAYISSFTTSNNLTKTGNTIVLPASSTSGFDTGNYSYVYNTGNKTSNCFGPGCYSYYSWDAATLGSGRSIGTDNTDAQQSICPKGWKLPSTYNGSGMAAEATDFRRLTIGYGGSNSIQTYNSSTTPTGTAMLNSIGPGSTPSFLLAGDYTPNSADSRGLLGYYWSSTSSSSTSDAQHFHLRFGFIFSASVTSRKSGFSVRCLFSGQ